MIQDKDSIGMKYCGLCNMILFQWKTTNVVYENQDRELDDNGFEMIINSDVEEDEVVESTCPICSSSLQNSYIYVTAQILGYIKEEAKSSDKPGISFTLTEEEKKSLGLYRISFTKIEEFKLRCFEGRLDNA
jgi:hypothetical protein